MVKNNLRKLREKRRLTQGDIAKAINVPNSLVSMIENGRGVLTRGELVVLSKLLECNEDDIYPEEVLKHVYGIGEKVERTGKPKRPYFNVSVPDVFAEALENIAQLERLGSRKEAAVELIREGVNRRNWGFR